MRSNRENDMRKILIIDDEKDYCLFVKQNLELMGAYNVVIANDGATGLEIASKDRPDLILLDIIMPRMNGFEVLKELKNNKKMNGIPVVMLTALDTEEAREKALSIYGEDYISKPVEMSVLKARIEAVLAKKL